MSHPAVGICTMAWHPLMKMHSICNALDQTYPNKHLYLMQQAPFPSPLQHDCGMPLTEINVAGKWPAVWMFKLEQFQQRCEEPLFALMDEDDRFHIDYLTKALQPIILDEALLAWSFNNIIIKNELMKGGSYPVFLHGRYRSGIGTLVGKTSELGRIIKRLKILCKNGLTEKGGGPVDAIMKNLIEKLSNQYKDRGLPYLVKHKGERRYFFHMNTNTKGDRDKRESIDYGWNERKAPGNFKGRKEDRSGRGIKLNTTI